MNVVWPIDRKVPFRSTHTRPRKAVAAHCDAPATVKPTSMSLPLPRITCAASGTRLSSPNHSTRTVSSAPMDGPFRWTDSPRPKALRGVLLRFRMSQMSSVHGGAG